MNKIHHRDSLRNTPSARTPDPVPIPTTDESNMDMPAHSYHYHPNGAGAYPMTDLSSNRQPMTKGEYAPVGSSRKLQLLMKRSLRYSYRQRCCGCCPTILCELLFPLILIGLLALTRYGTNLLVEKLDDDPGSLPPNYDRILCPQFPNETKPSSTNDLFSKCFKFPPSYSQRRFSVGSPSIVSNVTQFVFQPVTDHTRELTQHAQARLAALGCTNTTVLNQEFNADAENSLLQDTTINSVLVDFDSANGLKTERHLDYTIRVRMPGVVSKNDPVDLSFISFLHPTFIADRANVTDRNNNEGSVLPEFTDVKMFIDSLLINYQMNRPIDFEVQRTPMRCTPFHRDFIFESGAVLVTIVLVLVDLILLIPYLILLISLIREKNNKVKEILKVLGIEPLLNNIAQGLRTLFIMTILVLLLCIALKLKLKPYAYFNTVNFGVLLLGYLIYALQMISFCIMNAQLFEKSVRAVLGTFFVYLVSIILFPYIINWPAAVQYILIFISPYIAGHSLFQQAILHDLANKDVGFFEAVYRFVPMYFPTLIVMLVSCLFYWFLSWYLEKVFPGEYGIPLSWNFLCKREPKPANEARHSIASASKSRASLTRVHSNGAPIVHVNHLIKRFGPDKVAVNDVSFALYENQITSLLGPNGSGKTTIFNCLIGIYQQTSGTITMESEHGMSFDTRTNMDALRKSMGYCPQHDILFDLLTIREQLEFYAAARGFGKNKEQIATEMLRLVNLEGSQSLYCNSLSGGMKRRLSLACAFVGDTKIVLLDEPSSGLDPSNRRLLWDWLRSMKEGKTLLLTTHFMEESDALSDRIMIIANGNIRADGTSAKLKEQFGSGYKLVINKQGNFTTRNLQKELRPYLPNLKVETDVANGDVVFRTNQLPNEQFVQALRQLDVMKEDNRIKNYGVQNSTMDDVFLKITRETNDNTEGESTAVDVTTIERQCEEAFSLIDSLTGFKYYLNQCYGLLWKTLLVRYRRWALTLIIVLVPILYNVFANLISRSRSETGVFKMDSRALNPQTILYHAEGNFEQYLRASVSGAKLEQGVANISQMNEDIWQRRSKRLYTYTDIYLGFNIPPPAGDSYKIESVSSNLISSHEVFSIASNTLYKYLTNDTSASIRTTLTYKPTGNFTEQASVGELFNYFTTVAACFAKIIPTSLLFDVFLFYVLFFYTTVFLISERKDSFLSLLNISGLHPIRYWLTAYLFDLVAAVIWFCYLLAIYCLFDVIFNGLPEKTGTGVFSMLEFPKAWDLRVRFYPLTILIALPTLPFVYLLTKLFQSDILGGITICFLLFIIHFVSLVVPIVTMIVRNKMLRYLLFWLFNVLFPNVNAQVIIADLLARKIAFCKLMAGIGGRADDGSIFTLIGSDTMGVNYAILVAHILFFLLTLVVIDSGLLQFSCSCFYKPTFEERTLDGDVLAERQRILGQQTHTYEDEEEAVDHLTVNNLVKYYPMRKVLAVNHLTFGARRGEAFGLLGYNGAGKTTTFRVVVGDLMATQGTAYIDGQNVRRRIRSMRNLGYCPQEDCSMDFLTVRDSLSLLARIRGVRSSRLRMLVDTMSSLFLLDPFLNNYIHQLSGGTKRRLHAAIALIGPPLVAILDEPTTGVDPNARQQMQEIFLNAIKANLTIILTSHSMDECERVCNRLGIMVQGQLACLGTIQHLKSKFGQGYTIEVKVRTRPDDVQSAGIQNVQTFLLSQPNCEVEVKETTHSTGLFQVTQSTPAELFQLLEDNKQRLQIETYTISQTTLEQIFLSFGKQIRTEPDNAVTV